MPSISAKSLEQLSGVLSGNGSPKENAEALFTTTKPSEAEANRARIAAAEPEQQPVKSTQSFGREFAVDINEFAEIMGVKRQTARRLIREDKDQKRFGIPKLFDGGKKEYWDRRRIEKAVPPKGWIDRSEVAARLGVGKSTASRYMTTGLLGEAKMWGRAHLINEDALEDFVPPRKPKNKPVMPPIPEGYVTNEEACEMLNITRANLNYHTTSGNLPKPVKHYGRCFIRLRSDIEAFAEARTGGETATRVRTEETTASPPTGLSEADIKILTFGLQMYASGYTDGGDAAQTMLEIVKRA